MRSGRHLFVHRLQRSRRDIYEYLTFAQSWIGKFLKARRFAESMQHGGMHQSPPFNVHLGSRAIDETELMVTNALRRGKTNCAQ
jgi:hypothetical protein